MDTFWGSILVALILALILLALRRPVMACAVMAIVLTFWTGGTFAVAGIYMLTHGKEAATRDLNLGGLVIQIIFIFIFFITALVLEGRRTKRLKKLEDEIFALKHPKQGELRPR
jgi:hypothetical protein